MALQGIGGTGAASALEKFQAIRDIAKKRLEGGDSRVHLTNLVQKKQVELGLAQELTEISPAYSRAGQGEKSNSHPRLGRYIDFKA